MVYAHAFDGFIWAIEVVTLTLTGVVVLLSIFVVVLRLRFDAVARRRARLIVQWEALFRGESDELSPLQRGDRYTILLLYNRIRGELDASRSVIAREHADEVARRAHLDEFAMGLLALRDDADRIAGLSALGKLADPRAIGAGARYSNADGTELSRTAAEALIRLSPDSVERVVALVRDREDWAGSRVEAMLRLADQPALDAAMARTIEGAPPRGRIRLLDFLRCCSVPAARSIARSLLHEGADPEVVAAALRALSEVAEPSDDALVRPFLVAPDPFVRLAALRIMRRVASVQDAPVLGSLAMDADVWVRRRAAEALVALDARTKSSGTEESVSEADPFARDAIVEARAEMLPAPIS
ncbi:MAG: HEAT repeat domain-containing protein [Vulcanimicrobiaceae bacterium]